MLGASVRHAQSHREVELLRREALIAWVRRLRDRHSVSERCRLPSYSDDALIILVCIMFYRMTDYKWTMPLLRRA